MSASRRSTIPARRTPVCLPALCAAVLLLADAAAGQVVTQRGFVEVRGVGYGQTAPNDQERAVGDLLVREEVFVSPVRWLQFGGGVDLRANSHEQVEHTWRVDVDDRTLRRPRLALRRLSATVSAGGFTLDVGKQFIRWGRADIVYPTDRFAPRDFLNVFDAEFLPVLGVRPSFQAGSETVEAVWVPRFTPSRVPLLDQRWTVVPPEAEGIPLVDLGSRIPDGSQFGFRWRHTGERLETAVSYFDGFNHLPNIDVRVVPAPAAIELARVYPRIRMLGADAAIPSGVVTLKLEAAWVDALDDDTEEYVLYVVEIERQIGEWLIDAGYAGDVVTSAESLRPFAPDRGVAKSFIGRAAYTVDPRRTVAVEGAIRQGGEGVYGKVEFSQAFGQHWRLTLQGIAVRGDEGDFIGQFRRNSHASAAVRFSF